VSGAFSLFKATMNSRFTGIHNLCMTLWIVDL
jgi:hypothetical protein